MDFVGYIIDIFSGIAYLEFISEKIVCNQMLWVK